METKQKHTPKFLAPWTCPKCGETENDHETNPSGKGVHWYAKCKTCQLEYEQWTAFNPEPTQVVWQDEDYEIPPSPDEIIRQAAPALLAACKDVLGQYEWDRLQYEDRDHDRVAASIRQLRAAIDLAEKGE